MAEHEIAQILALFNPFRSKSTIGAIKAVHDTTEPTQKERQSALGFRQNQTQRARTLIRKSTRVLSACFSSGNIVDITWVIIIGRSLCRFVYVPDEDIRILSPSTRAVPANVPINTTQHYREIRVKKMTGTSSRGQIEAKSS